MLDFPGLTSIYGLDWPTVNALVLVATAGFVTIKLFKKK